MLLEKEGMELLVCEEGGLSALHPVCRRRGLDLLLLDDVALLLHVLHVIRGLVKHLNDQREKKG